MTIDSKATELHGMLRRLQGELPEGVHRMACGRLAVEIERWHDVFDFPDQRMEQQLKEAAQRAGVDLAVVAELAGRHLASDLPPEPTGEPLTDSEIDWVANATSSLFASAGHMLWNDANGAAT